MIRGFALSPAALDDLARGGPVPGDPAAMERGKNILLLHTVVARSRALDHPGAPATADAYRLLARIQQAAPSAAAEALGYPLLGTWASATVAALNRGEDATPQRLAALAATAALMAGVPVTAPFTTSTEMAELPGLGRLLLPGVPADEPVTLIIPAPGRPRATTGSPTPHHQPGVAAGGPARSAPAHQPSTLGQPVDPTSAHQPSAIGEPVGPASACLEVAGERFPLPHDLRATVAVGGARWEGVRDVGFLLDDVDPWRFPGPIPPLGRLADVEAEAWGAVLDQAREVLKARHPGVARALEGITKVVVPIAPPEAGTRSATARTAYGSVAMSWPHDARSAALTLTHEVQHAKLTMLMDLFDLVRPGARGHYYAPWRDDPRPAAALLQGAYAHMGVAGFWRAERHVTADSEVAHSEFARWRDAAHEACLTLLTSGTVTALGRRFVEGMLETLAAWRAERVPAEASALARRAATRHRLQWAARHGT
ncbi:HEXXH motif-containing putative peptide modification protein [Nonomuraea sp. NPDC004580]|uniref:aKG-HExxH-type peptide beta-hydroxylase n=1 Tax=Nonomuraea sp. NPDC004580 TaxID=3154552 RepID=UPI0033A6B745